MRRAERGNRGDRELIGALVHLMPGVALDPMPAHVVLPERRIEPFPEVDVLHRLLVGGLPAVALPAVDPFRNAIMDVFAVSVQLDRAGFLRASRAAIAPISSMRLLVV